MKRILLILMTMISTVSLSQLSTVNPDTVCYQSTVLSTYTIPSVGSGTYTWAVASPGVITAGQGTNSISVNWSAAAPGLITNCPATPVNLNVLIYQVIPTITTLGPFCESDPCVNLVGTPVGGTWSGLGVSGNQFCPDNVTNGTNATSTVTYTVGSAGCTFSTSVVVPVFGTPTLQPIQHN
jgi:hypothetical protein